MKTVDLRYFIKQLLENGMGTSRNMSLTSKYSGKYRNNKNYPFHKFKSLKKEESDSINEITPEEVEIPKELIHNSLNQNIWNEDKTLKPEVRKKLLQIVTEFYKYLNIKISIKHIRLIGSMANYNWSSKSDIDLHLFFDFKDLHSDYDFAYDFFNTKKDLWNLNHNITIKGFTVELYCNSTEDSYFSSGVFNLWENKWENEPTKENFKVDTVSLQIKTSAIINAIETLETNKDLSIEEKHDKAELLKEKIKKMRQSGLEEKGEFSIENLSFKYLRNNNYISRLFDIIQKSFDANLSLK